MFILMSIVHEVINIATNRNIKLNKKMYLRLFHMLEPNKVHTLYAHAAISCIVAHQILYHSDL